MGVRKSRAVNIYVDSLEGFPFLVQHGNGHRTTPWPLCAWHVPVEVPHQYLDEVANNELRNVQNLLQAPAKTNSVACSTDNAQAAGLYYNRWGNQRLPAEGHITKAATPYNLQGCLDSHRRQKVQQNFIYGWRGRSWNTRAPYSSSG